MNSERVLNDLSPPLGGWQRLITRRDTASKDYGWGVPLAAAAALALVVLLIRPQAQDLQLPWESGRLLQQQSEGVGVQDANGTPATALPSDDPRVRLYMLQETNVSRDGG